MANDKSQPKSQVKQSPKNLGVKRNGRKKNNIQ